MRKTIFALVAAGLLAASAVPAAAAEKSAAGVTKSQTAAVDLSARRYRHYYRYGYRPYYRPYYAYGPGPYYGYGYGYRPYYRPFPFGFFPFY